jgi:Glycosyltransferase family 10 (fucosyltransferase) C-term
MKKRLKLQDLSFYGNPTSAKCGESRFIEWDRSPGKGDLVFFTDKCLPVVDMPVYKSSYKIAWILEPFVIRPQVYDWIVQNYTKFDMVLTHHTQFLNIDQRFRYYPSAMTEVGQKFWGPPPTPPPKCLSIIASDKNYAPGHKLRHQFIREFRNSKPELLNKFDIYGREYNRIEDKGTGLQDYRYSITIENCQVECYFTEKIIDCFATFTIPIYWGCDGVKRFFYADGIIMVNDITDLLKAAEFACSKDGEDFYNQKLEVMKENYNKALNFQTAEDWIYLNILVPEKLV